MVAGESPRPRIIPRRTATTHSIAPSGGRVLRFEERHEFVEVDQIEGSGLRCEHPGPLARTSETVKADSCVREGHRCVRHSELRVDFDPHTSEIEKSACPTEMDVAV